MRNRVNRIIPFIFFIYIPPKNINNIVSIQDLISFAFYNFNIKESIN
jgi:hypothetical protein